MSGCLTDDGVHGMVNGKLVSTMVVAPYVSIA